MSRSFAVLLALALFATAAVAQTTKKTDQKPATQKAESPAAPDAPSAARPALPSAATVNGFLAHTFGYDPSIKWQIAQIKPSPSPYLTEVDVVLSNEQGQQMTKLFVTADGKYTAVGDLLPFGADPYADARNELQARAQGPSQGPADPALTIVEFGDLQCPSCKAAQPAIEKLLADVPNAKLVFQPFPLTQMHKWAMKAALFGECVAKQSNDAYFKFMKDVYQNQDQITADAGPGMTFTPDATAKVEAALKQSATGAGANTDQVASCAALPDTEAKVKQSIALGVSLEVTGTPTLFLNGRKIANMNGMPPEVLKQIADYQATHK